MRITLDNFREKFISWMCEHYNNNNYYYYIIVICMIIIIIIKYNIVVNILEGNFKSQPILEGKLSLNVIAYDL